MDQFSKETKELLACGEHCISLYMPTNRAPVEGRQDLIRFKNMVRESEEWLIRWGLRPPEAKEYLASLTRLPDDVGFWQYRGDGLALFYSGDIIRQFRLPVSFDELLVVANRFHLKPLIPLLTEDAEFYVLALSQNEIRLIEETGAAPGRWSGACPASLADAIKNDAPGSGSIPPQNVDRSGGRQQYFCLGDSTTQRSPPVSSATDKDSRTCSGRRSADAGVITRFDL
jgi:hypothetical protein